MFFRLILLKFVCSEFIYKNGYSQNKTKGKESTYVFEVDSKNFSFDFIMEEVDFYVIFPDKYYNLQKHKVQSEIELIHNQMIYKRKIETEIENNLFSASFKQYIDKAMAKQMMDDFGENLEIKIIFKISTITNPL